MPESLHSKHTSEGANPAHINFTGGVLIASRAKGKETPLLPQLLHMPKSVQDQAREHQA